MKDKLKGKEEEVLAKWDSGVTMTILAKEYGVASPSLREFLIKKGRDTSRRISSDMLHLEVKDAAYIAGILDGEGCITAHWVKSRGGYYAQSNIMVSNTSRCLIDYLTRVTGIGFGGEYQRKDNDKCRLIYSWIVTSWQGVELLQQVKPYLQIKQEQADLFIELAELKRQSRPSYRFKEERQKEIIAQFRMLNRRGNLVEVKLDVEI